MNNQFATQFLMEDTSELKNTVVDVLQDTGVTDEHLIKIMTDAVMNGVITLEKALQIIQNPHVDETTGSGGAGGGSTTGGGVTDGASWDPQGPTGSGEQYAAGTRKKKYQEGTFEDDEIAIFDGGEDGLTKIYKKADGSFYGVNDSFDFIAKDEQELLRKTAMWGYQLISGTVYENTSRLASECIPVEELEAILKAYKSERDDLIRNLVAKYGGDASLTGPRVAEDAPRLAGDPSKTNKQGSKNLNAYKSVGFTKAPSAQEAGKKLKSIDIKDLWEDGEGLNESRAYSKFKREAATRTKDQQMHEAVKMIHNKLEEISKLVEFTQQMRNELSEGEGALEYKHNTKKVFEKINSKVVEVYAKTKQLK